MYRYIGVLEVICSHSIIVSCKTVVSTVDGTVETAP